MKKSSYLYLEINPFKECKTVKVHLKVLEYFTFVSTLNINRYTMVSAHEILIYT